MDSQHRNIQSGHGGSGRQQQPYGAQPQPQMMYVQRPVVAGQRDGGCGCCALCVSHYYFSSSSIADHTTERLDASLVSSAGRVSYAVPFCCNSHARPFPRHSHNPARGCFPAHNFHPQHGCNSVSIVSLGVHSNLRCSRRGVVISSKLN